MCAYLSNIFDDCLPRKLIREWFISQIVFLHGQSLPHSSLISSTHLDESWMSAKQWQWMSHALNRCAVLVYYEVFSYSPELIKMMIACGLVTFLVAVTEHLTRINLMFYLRMVLMRVAITREGIMKEVWGNWLHHDHSQEAEKGEYCHWVNFLAPFTDSSIPVNKIWLSRLWLDFLFNYGNTIIGTLKICCTNILPEYHVLM